MSIPISIPPDVPFVHDERPRFSRSFAISVAIHVLLFAGFVTKQVLLPPPPLEIIPPALRVDIVGLPDIMKKDLNLAEPAPKEDVAEKSEKKVEAKKEKIVEKAPVKEVDEFALKKKQQQEIIKNERKAQDALSRIKALARIEGMRDQGVRNSVVVKGNQISQGAGLTGQQTDNAKALYLDVIRNRLRQFWELPLWLSRQNLSAQVQMSVDGAGHLKSFRFIRGSGNQQFDDAVENTLKAASPYPPPPNELAAVLVNGISLGFPL